MVKDVVALALPSGSVPGLMPSVHAKEIVWPAVRYATVSSDPVSVKDPPLADTIVWAACPLTVYVADIE